MRKLYKLYKDQQTAQYLWIRKHPVKYVTLNVTLLAVLIGFIEYCERRWTRQLNETAEIIRNES